MATMAAVEDSSRTEANEGYDYEDAAAATSCGCLSRLCRRWSCKVSHRYVLYQRQCQQDGGDNWLAKKVKELSEVLGGPRWRVFIRRLRLRLKKKRRMQLQYDPKSYALNFDDGAEKEGDVVFVDFLVRYADPFGIMRGDLGR